MSQGLDATPTTDELLDVDTSFLDRFRRDGADGLRKAFEDAERDAVEQPPAEPERESPTAQRGGSSAASGASAAAVPSSPSVQEQTEPVAPDDVLEDVVDAVLDDTVAAPAVQLDEDRVPPVPLQHTDHQEAVQAAAARGGSGGGDDGGSEALPQTGFRLIGMKSQPAVRALPKAVVSALREQLRAAAVRELGVGDAAAREFADRLSQASLVTAFLLSQLDLGLDADPATARAAQLFRSCDPLLGSIAARIQALEQLERERQDSMTVLREELGRVRETSAAVEQAVAYSIADREMNFLRGSHDIHQAPIAHKDAVYVRDRIREETKRQRKLEREREGRPIR